MILPTLIIARSDNRGRGVFTTEKIHADTVVEVSPVLGLSEEERKEVEKTALFNYIFEWGEEMKGACVAWGYLSIYNHSYHANCVYEMDFDEQTMQVRTVRDIEAGEELFTNYNATPDDETKIWFETV